ncbi:hypothetical protein [Legionella rowbothamii]|uniref:hypothetical protein n=1 Tax=Legionella rowbothamii TaxID=96229 RepID=UPI001055E55C|nr:hypothetical protein [Legionella rowbothamii]
MSRDKFFKSEKNISAEPINTDKLAAVVIQYVKTISQGIYDFKIPKTKDGFTKQQKSCFIKQLLNNSSIDFPLSKVPDSIDANLYNIVNLAASLMLFEKISNLNASQDRLAALQAAGIAFFVNVGMPGPIIIYADAIEKCDNFDDISIQATLRELLDKLNTRENTFPNLTPVAFTYLFQNWTNIVSLFNAQHRARIDTEITRLTNINQNLSQMIDSTELSFIDKCIATIWNKLEINIPAPILMDEVIHDDLKKKY